MSLFDKFLSKMKTIKYLKKIQLLWEDRGDILVLTALLLPIMFGCLGIAYDLGNIYIHKARLQNVTDAAALAGGRAYLQSQLKTGESVHKDTYDNYTNGNVTDEEYVIGGSKTRSGYHPDADKAADDYIYKNIVNLGEKVYSDKFSHYALPGLKKNGEDYINAEKIFYRIGLYEIVPLHFLPVITKKKFETVRAGSVVVVEQGTTTTTIIPGTGETPTGYTLFDKLFAVEKKVVASRDVVSPQNTAALSTKPSQNGGTIKTTFDGEIVYAGSAWDSSDAADEVQDSQMGGYLYTKEEQAYQLANDLSIQELNKIPNMGVKSVFDSSIKIDSYVDSFMKKLLRPHIEFKVDNQDFNTNHLTSITNSNAHAFYAVATANGTIYYQNESAGNYYSCIKTYLKINDNLYYVCEKGDSGYFDAGGNNWISLNSYVNDSKNNQIFIYHNNDSMSFYKKITKDMGGWFQSSIVKINNVLKTSDTDAESKYSYTEDGVTFTFAIGKINANFSQSQKVPKEEIVSPSVYHYWTGVSGSSVALNVNGGLDGDESKPIYVIVTEGNPKINVSQSNERPVIYCYLGSSTQLVVSISPNVTFKGLIYAPNIQVQFKNGKYSNAHFIGNVIANNIDIEEAGSSFTQKNFVANDGDLNTVNDEIAAAQKARKLQAMSLAKEYLKEYLGSLISDSAWEDPSWFGSLTAKKRQEITEAWYNARQQMWVDYGLDMPDWPWSTGGKTTDKDKYHYSPSIDTGGGSTGSQTIIETTPETLRLINYRTEFQLKEEMGNDDVVDPFIFETLSKPNSY